MNKLFENIRQVLGERTFQASTVGANTAIKGRGAAASSPSPSVTNKPVSSMPKSIPAPASNNIGSMSGFEDTPASTPPPSSTKMKGVADSQDRTDRAGIATLRRELYGAKANDSGPTPSPSTNDISNLRKASNSTVNNPANKVAGMSTSDSIGAANPEPMPSTKMTGVADSKDRVPAIATGRGSIPNNYGDNKVKTTGTPAPARSGPASVSTNPVLDNIKKFFQSKRTADTVNPSAKTAASVAGMSTSDSIGATNPDPISPSTKMSGVADSKDRAAAASTANVPLPKEKPGVSVSTGSTNKTNTKTTPTPKARPTTNTSSTPKSKPVVKNNTSAASSKPAVRQSSSSNSDGGPAFSMDNYRNAVASGANKQKALRAGAGIKEDTEKEKEMPQNLLDEKKQINKAIKNIIRGMKGWGHEGMLTSNNPKEMVKRHKEMDDDTVKQLKKSTDSANIAKGSPADLQKKLLNREYKKRKMSEENIFTEKELAHFESVMGKTEEVLPIEEAKRGRPSKNDYETLGPNELHMNAKRAADNRTDVQHTFANGEKTKMTKAMGVAFLNRHSAAKTADQKDKILNHAHSSLSNFKDVAEGKPIPDAPKKSSISLGKLR